MKLTDKLLTLLGFAAKAGKLSYGMDASVASVRAGKAKLVIVSGEISAKSRKEVTFYCTKYNAEVIILGDYDIQAVSGAVGRKCGITAVNDSSFAKALKVAAQGGNA